MTSSLDLIRGRQVVQTLTNQSGGAIIAGDVVIVSAANDESFTTTTSAAYNSTRVGVALESIAAAAAGRILLEGYAPLVNVSASATRGHYLLTHTVAKQATSQAGYAAGAFGQILKAGTTPSAVIFPVAQVGSAGVARSGSTTDGHLAVWNGSNADSIKDGGVAGAGAMTQIAQVVVGVGGASTIDFSSIPATYESLRLIAVVRNDKAATLTVDCWLRFNNDSGGNYDFEWVSKFATTVAANELFGQTKGYIGGCQAATSTANIATPKDIFIPGYARTVFNKSYLANSNQKTSTSSGGITLTEIGGAWRSTAAINQITILPDSDKFVEGSVATLYGIL